MAAIRRQQLPPRKTEPTYELIQVQQLISRAIIGSRTVSKAREACGLELEREVKAYIRSCIKNLQPTNFAYSEWQSYGPDSCYADIYALENEVGPWFIKFFIKDGQVQITSCHAPEDDLKCADGRIVKAL